MQASRTEKKVSGALRPERGLASAVYLVTGSAYSIIPVA